MTGTTPATEASKRSCTLCSRAVAHSSSPCWESSCLFAVTTWRPDRMRLQDVVARRLDAADELDDQVRALEDLLEVAARAGEHARELGAQAGDRLDLVGARRQQLGEGRADRAVAEQPDVRSLTSRLSRSS